ncbi:gamma-tubulin complex component 6 [Haematobia irritans]|uniref:gamma-tubulin complex component 6 n=1 Tax=Haematobia irritans TaxID=7368 RepID=UPI003F506419
MPDLEENEDGNVSLLLNKLCYCILNQYDMLNQEQKSTAVAKLRKLSFEILLTQKGKYDEDEYEDFERTLDVQMFSAKLNSRTNYVSTNFSSIEEQFDNIKNEQYFTDGTGKGVLQFLLALQGNIQDKTEVPTMSAPELLVPGPFTLHADYKNSKHYPMINGRDNNIMQPVPKYFKGVTHLKSTDNPFLPKFIFEGEKDQLLAIDYKFPQMPSHNVDETECSFTGMTKRLLGSSLRINLNSLRLFPESLKLQQTKSLTMLVPKIEEGRGTNKENEFSSDSQMKKIFSWNWEGLGCFGISCTKPFAGDTNASLLLKCHIDRTNKKPFESKILKEKDFITDLKSLIVGIQSNTFKHDEFIIFSMEKNICIEGVLPGTLLGAIDEFLECGSCYKRLQTMILKKDYKLMFEGFMFKALCSAIDEYLLTFRQYVFARNDKHILGFYKRIKPMMKQIANLSQIMAIHPNVDVNFKPPMGSQFLGYLYGEIMRTTESDFLSVLIFILKRCCHVYFKHLQKWIFYGLLDDPCNELFVGFVDHYRENTKYYYDKAYFVRREVVPGFFQNFEDQILQSGKYTMLLKAYNPNHPIFELEYPSISVCLSVGDLQDLERTCKNYFENARKLCSNPITIQSVFESRSEEKRQFFQRMVEKSRANLEKWNDEQNEVALIKAEKKKKRLEELSAQLQDAKQRKILERKAGVELELKYLREAEKIEEQRTAQDNINLRKRIEYYQELYDTIKEKEQGKPLTLAIPSSVMQPQSARTPASAGTDFESCFGEDEDQSSEYEECVSEEFIDKFNENQLETVEQISEPNVLDKDLTTETEIRGIENVVKVTDIINHNSRDFSMENNNILQQNRQKIMSGFNVGQCIQTLGNDDRQKSNTVEEKLGETYSLKINTKEKDITATVLTDAQKNKFKVLNQEYGISHQNTRTKSMPDINLNMQQEGPNELSDLQRNRQRMMQNDLFSEYNKPSETRASNLYLDLDSERARNRRKVLESEYNILTGKGQIIPSITTETVDTPITPMSTASDDIPLTETISDNEADKNNGNISKNNLPETTNQIENAYEPKLKLDVSCFKQQESVLLNTPNTVLDTTPECALNTAGIMAKQGFSFPPTESHKNQQKSSTDGPVNNNALQHEDACPQPDYLNPYKRCKELIDTNFTCNTISPYIRLNSCKRNANKSNSATLTEFLTEFLQKSLIIPMETHLELINNEVMRMFLDDLKVLDHFRSLRNYFFMMDGEFGSIICDGIIGKLEEGAKPEKLLNYQILHSILDTALGSSITGKDKNAENLSFIVNDVPEKFELNSPDVLNNLSLSYRINWPLNLILNPETLEQYANIFKYLVRVRRISWILERAYQILKESVKRNGKDVLKSPQYRHIQLIRHKFYHFVHALQNHITGNALQASWKTFKDELLGAKTIEDIYRKHTTYIKRILFLCMLNKRSAEFYNTIDSVFKISIRFYNNLKSREFKLKPGEDYYTHSRYDKLVNDELEFNKFIKYTIYLGNKIVRHGYQAEIGEFINLLNHNQYYMKSSF